MPLPDCVALVLQGGGALGSYQAGVLAGFALFAGLLLGLADLATRGVVTKAEAQSRSMNPNLFGSAASLSGAA